MYVHDEVTHNYDAAKIILPFLASEFKFKSVIDIGCGLGTWLKVASEIGVEEVLGLDGLYVDRSLLKIPYSSFLPADLNENIDMGRKFDLAICLEVAEHLSHSSSDIIVNTITNHSDLILFSAAIPGQGGQNHVNEQWPDFWEKKFRAKGFVPYDILRYEFWENQGIEWWYRQNILLYVRTSKHSVTEKAPVRLVHPELYQMKLSQIQALKDTSEKLKIELNKLRRGPGVITSIKLLFKSILKSFS